LGYADMMLYGAKYLKLINFKMHYSSRICPSLCHTKCGWSSNNFRGFVPYHDIYPSAREFKRKFHRNLSHSQNVLFPRGMDILDPPDIVKVKLSLCCL